MFYRFRQKLNYGLFAYRVREIHKSPPIACDPTAACEVHTMLSAQDFYLYLLAIKSLLRFCPSLAVLVHSDGSLDESSALLLRRHIPGCRVISTPEADDRARRSIGSESFMFHWRAHDPCWRRLIDTELWSAAPKRIVMDSDILVLNRPGKLLEWIQRGIRPFLLGQPPNNEQVNGGPATNGWRQVQTVFKEKIPALSSCLGFPNCFLDGSTAGFYGSSGELSLERIETVLRKSVELGVPMEQWGSDQCTIIYILSIAGAERLDPERCLNFEPALINVAASAEILHFYGTYRFYKNVYPRLASKIATRLLPALTATS